MKTCILEENQKEDHNAIIITGVKNEGENYSANTVHAEIAEILKDFSLKKKYIQSLKSDAEFKLDTGLKEKKQQLLKANSEFDV